ncbi:hypothetical protein [Roseisolibacter sp. H3M3-2]|uniref:hypothetical protein n=1 Tax=Roseisolibacter sp. H3M3-2 TaxID=3031323 RepID=UPI0023DC4330|nr:hypothetical protein [Roseisolibacter sp. H3M3-2]MDF1503090.1 hypothetical protein [Roseisolibacter sp. H3M3-2]
MPRPRSVLAVLLLAAACGDADSRRPAADSATATPEGPRVVMGTTTRLGASPNAVAPGEEFSVRFEIRNDYADTLRLTQTCSAPARVAIRASNAPAGAPALETTTCKDTVVTHDVPPNASVVLQFPTRASAKSEPLAPGLYVIEATPTITQANGRPFVISPVTTELLVR